MALLGFDGFTNLQSSTIGRRGYSTFVSSLGGSITITNTTGINGNYLRVAASSATINPSATGVVVPVPINAEIIVGFWFRCTSLTAESAVIYFREGGTVHATLTISSTGRFRIRRGGGLGDPVLNDTGDGAYTLNTWVFVEVRVLVGDTTGEVELHLDGSLIFNTPSLDTQNGATGVIDNFVMAASVANFTQNSANNFDDVYWSDTSGPAPTDDFLGPVRTDTLLPNSDVAVDFTPSSGSDNYAMLDEAIPNDDTDYTESSTTPGDQDVFGLTDLPSVSGIIFGVQTRTVAKRTDSGALNLVPSIISNAVEQDGAPHALPVSYDEFADLFPRNPDGDVVWDDAAVNALQVAYRVPT